MYLYSVSMDNIKITYTTRFTFQKIDRQKGKRIKLNVCTTQQSNFSCLYIGVIGWWAEEIMVLTNCGYICYNNPDQKQNKTKIKQKLEFELEVNRT